MSTQIDHSPPDSGSPSTGVLLIHGVWHGGWTFDQTASALRDRGCSAVVVDQLPSTRSDPTKGLYADAAHVCDVMTANPHDAWVLVGHSYGGMVLAELAGNPIIAHAVYVAAFAPLHGQSAGDLFGPPLDWHVFDDPGLMTVDPAGARRIMAGNAPPPTTSRHTFAVWSPRH
jgi:pimeloyl-ACP methyl ester carboxylesterase